MTWVKPGREGVSLQGLSREGLASFEDEFVARWQTSVAFLEPALAIGSKRGDVSLVQRALGEIPGLPKPRNLADLASRVHLHLAAYSAIKGMTHLDLAAGFATELTATWDALAQDGPVVAPDAAASAVALFLAADATGRDDLAEHGRGVLRFLRERMLGDHGAYHRFDPRADAVQMDGQLLDNAAVGLAFLEGHRVTREERYWEVALALADFILERLHDRRLGGFFARSSSSLEYYGPDELFLDDKPVRANGLAALLLVRIGGRSDDTRYAEAAVDTILALQAKLAEVAPQDGAPLLTAYRTLIEVEEASAGRPRGLADVGIGLMAFLAFVAGVLGFLSPCTLPILPAYFAFAFQAEKRTIFSMTFAFFLGLACSFSAMGATATFLGSSLQEHYDSLLRGRGLLIAMFGVASLLGRGFSGVHFKTRSSATFLGSFLFGLTFSLGWTACIGPILGAILVLAATQGRAAAGAVLLFVFAMGLGVPLMALSLCLQNIDREGAFWKLLRGKGWDVSVGRVALHLHSTGILSGLLFISLGVLTASGQLTYLNRVLPIGIQAWFVGLEEVLVGFFSR
jgi:cytochrome c-type biogenesis protein